MPTAATAAPMPLRVALLWNGALQQEELLDTPRSVTLGSAGGSMFPLPDGVFAADDAITLLEPSGPAYALRPNPHLGGFVSIGGQRYDARGFRELQQLGPSDYGVVTLGSVALFFQHVQPTQGARPDHSDRDPAVLACLGLSIFLHVGALLFLFLVAAKEFAPAGALELDTELVKRFLVVPPPIDEPLLQRRKAATETKAPGLRDRDEMGGKKQEKAEGKVGKKDATREDTQIAGEPKDAVANKVRGMGLLGVLSGGGPNNALHSALDTPSLDKMLGGLGALQTVVGRGSGGFGLRGSGVGGGGTGKGTLFGAGELGTGVGAGNGSGRGKGKGGIGLPGPKAKEAQLSLDESGAKVHGFLSKEQIDRVVRANQAAIKYCFEVEMQRQPKLEGAVHMNWRIDLSGQVTVVHVAKSTLDNPRVEGCMTRQIKRWVFPKPDGGEVDVTYPFLLRGS
jgi:outer membrane biosynthesis protein TonB